MRILFYGRKTTNWKDLYEAAHDQRAALSQPNKRNTFWKSAGKGFGSDVVSADAEAIQGTSQEYAKNIGFVPTTNLVGIKLRYEGKVSMHMKTIWKKSRN